MFRYILGILGVIVFSAGKLLLSFVLIMLKCLFIFVISIGNGRS